MGVLINSSRVLFWIMMSAAFVAQMVSCKEVITANNQEVNGDNIQVIGSNNFINGNFITANGDNNQIRGNSANVFGDNVKIWGNDGTVQGENAVIEGEGIFKVTGNNAKVRATEVSVDGNDANIVALKTNVNGDNAVVEGGVATVTGANVRVVGPNAVVTSNNAFVTGPNAKVSGYNPIVHGSSAFICTDIGRDVKVTGNNINIFVNFKYYDRQVYGKNDYDNKVEVKGEGANIISARENCVAYVSQGNYDYSAIKISGQNLAVMVKGQVVAGSSYNADGNSITIIRN